MTNLILSQRDYKLTRQEGVYHVNVFGNIASAGGTINLHIENPPNSGVRVILTNVKTTSKGPTTILTPHGFNVDSTGSSKTAVNNAIGSSNTPTANAYQDSNYSGASTTHEEYVGSGGTGTGNRPPTGGTSIEVGAVIEEGQDYIIELVNDDTTNAHDMSISAEFYETTPTQA